jgi:hypothetical protein
MSERTGVEERKGRGFTSRQALKESLSVTFSSPKDTGAEEESEEMMKDHEPVSWLGINIALLQRTIVRMKFSRVRWSPLRGRVLNRFKSVNGDQRDTVEATTKRTR